MSGWSINKVRDTFLQFFNDKKHTRVDSSPILPAEDATLLFTNAGMNQFKNIFMGQETRSYSRACSAQKCVRAGGKHNDLENVGFTARHHTFFEMLGNFSFGDYFKEEAIAFAWELLTEVYKLPKERLYVTVFETDDEALAIWRDKIGVPEERIFRLGEKDNFWAMGETGPCGPCSEVHYDLGEGFICEAPFVDGQPDWDCGRFVEIWNLVFMQYNRASDGTMTPLPKPSIDTGMGLERVTAILNGKMSNYDIDVFVDLKKTITQFLPENSNIIDTSLNVIADHARATAFLIADTITPSNEGRGYVLRRIMRRAIRHGHKIGFQEPFFYRICEKVIALMNGAYPSLETQKELILNIALEEEKRFGQTLEKGLELLDTGIEDIIACDKKILPGDLVFKLYDTFGFPPDLTDSILQERDLSYDKDEYAVAMEKQRNRGKASWSKSL
ncbi:alanine--tRNA ligase, partial [bacterium]|nr:alanine--tRNA ligase [bacterium]